MENSNIIKTLQEKINILQEMYGHDQSNKKAIIHQLIDTNQKLQEELENEMAKIKVNNTINYYDYLYKNNKQLKFNCPKLFYLLKQVLNSKKIYNDITLLYENDNDLTKINILSNINNIRNLQYLPQKDLFEILQEELGKKEIFLRYIGKNNKDFLNFQKIANKKSLDRRMIYTDRNYPIYYYGGTDKEDVTNKLDHIYEYAKKNGVNFKTEDFQKSLILRKDKK